LAPQQIYTRKQLQAQFLIHDATIRTGIFKPKGQESVWIFVTEDKPKDAVQYQDHLQDRKLFWDGQLSGGKDQLIIDHQKNGLELVVFYRKDKRQYEGAGFRYLGPFRYISHTGSSPAHFVLEMVDEDTVGERNPRVFVDPVEREVAASAERRERR
jgi:hypothetical protein